VQRASAARLALDEREEGTLVRLDAHTTLRAYLLRWLEDVQPTMKPRTWVNYESRMRLHLLPLLGDTPLAKLTASDVLTPLASHW
jgi:hypothetical protein